MSKPDWKDAPSWAEWLAQDSDGWWFWYESRPAILGEFPDEWMNRVETSDHRSLISERGQPNPNWRTTLERRPDSRIEQEGHGTTRGDADAKSEAVREALDVTSGEAPAWGNAALLSELMAIAYARGYMGLNDEQIQDIQRGMRKALDDLERKLPSMLPDAPDLIIPKDAAAQIEAYSFVSDLARMGYRLEIDDEGIRGWLA